MSLFTKLFPRASVNQVTGSYFETLTGYQPAFRSFSGGVYEAELCRACIHAFATHASKLKPAVTGARKDLGLVLESEPNPWMDTTKFLYNVATILENENTAFIVPLFDAYYQRIVGYYPVLSTQASIIDHEGTPYVVFSFPGGKRGAIELSRCGIINKFLYKRGFFGETNDVLYSTLSLMSTQQQGIEDGIKQSAAIRFLGRLANVYKDKDIDAERERWRKGNLASGNNGGIAIVDAKYADIKQIESKPYTINAEELQAVRENVFSYFGCNKDILQNSFTSSQWDAYYEGKIEPFAVQLSLVLTNMTYTQEQRTRGNKIQFTSNRLQYSSPEAKLQVVVQLVDRGMMSRNEGREVFNMEPVEGGDEYIIRAEYVNAEEHTEPHGEGGE